MSRTMTMTLAAAAIAALPLTGCGGGGGGGSSIAYTGVTTQAAVTNDNALALAGTAYDGGKSGGSLAFVGVASGPADAKRTGTAQVVNASRVLINAVHAANLNPSSERPVATGAATSGSLPSTCGGSATYSGTANESTGELHVTFRFNAWCNEGVTVSGTLNASGHVDVNTQELASLEFSFSVLTISDGTNTFQGHGTIAATFGASDVLTIDMDYSAGDGTIYRASNLTVVTAPDLGNENVTITGRVFHPLHGYVDVTTPQPLTVVAGDDYPSSGELVVTGAGDSHARVTALSATTFQLDLDEDGNGVYEATVGTFEWGTREPVIN